MAKTPSFLLAAQMSAGARVGLLPPLPQSVTNNAVMNWPMERARATNAPAGGRCWTELPFCCAPATVFVSGNLPQPHFSLTVPAFSRSVDAGSRGVATNSAQFSQRQRMALQQGRSALDDMRGEMGREMRSHVRTPSRRILAVPPS